MSVQYKMKLSTVLFSFLLILEGFPKGSSLFKMTNFQCESFNKSWVVVQECRLRAIKRDVSTLNLKVDFLYPTYNIDLQIEVLKKANGYKPFLYNITIDYCAFMKKRNNPIFGVVYDLYKDFTNVNHTCPYVGQQIVSGCYLRHELFQLPLPAGEYALWLTWYFHSKKVLINKVYWTFADKQ